MLTELLPLKPCRTFVQPSVGVHGLDMCAFGPCHFFGTSRYQFCLIGTCSDRGWGTVTLRLGGRGTDKVSTSLAFQNSKAFEIDDLYGSMKSGPKSTECESARSTKGNMSKYGQCGSPLFQTSDKLQITIRTNIYL